jgi:signal transduction histidine kinase
LFYLLLVRNKIILGGLIVIFLTVVSTAVYGSLISEQIRLLAIERAETTSGSYVTSIAQSELTVNDFDPTNFDEKKVIFSKFFQHLESEETIRIKVWSKDGTIIYSDDENIVGENFKENIRFQTSIDGQLTSEIKNPVDPENVSELGYSQLMEIYVPIWLDSTEPVGVIELYCTMDSTNESVEQVNFLLFEITLILIGIISSSVILFSIVMARYSRKAVEQEKFVTLGRLSSRVAHDLRNPLSVIKNVATLNEMSSPKTKEESNKRNKMIISAVERMTHQINDVMEFVKTKHLNTENVSLKTVIDSTKNNMTIPKDVKILYDGDDLVIKAEPKLLEALFSNLFLNSIHAMDGHGEITIKVSDEKDQIIIKVVDQGPGIQKSNLSQIFSPLFTTKQEGTGLGLYSCKSIVNQHGGTIHFSNDPSTFTIKLPKTVNTPNGEKNE